MSKNGKRKGDGTSSSASEPGTSSASERSETSPVDSPSSTDSNDCSSSSDEEMFYDAIEASGTLISRYLSKTRTSRGDLTLVPGESLSETISKAKSETLSSSNDNAGISSQSEIEPVTPVIMIPPITVVRGQHSSSASVEDIPPPPLIASSNSSRLAKFEETLQRLNSNPDETVEEQSSSQTSSVDGLYPQRQSRPFKVVEQDSVSLSASRSRPPDIVSSCVTTTTEQFSTTSASSSQTQPATTQSDVFQGSSSSKTSVPPIPPPRRRKRNKSPTVSISSHIGLDRETLGHGVVTAQDEERTRSKTSGPRVLRRTESLGLVGNSGNVGVNGGSLEIDSVKSLVLKEQDASDIGGSDAMLHSSSLGSNCSGGTERKNSNFTGLIRTKTDSGKMLSDLEILEQVTVVNLDTGEKIPLSSAEDRIPKCINPLSLHIMRLTSEYVSEEKSVEDSDDDSKKSTTSSTFKRRGLRLRKLFSDVKIKAIHKARSLKSKSLNEDSTPSTLLLFDSMDGPPPLEATIPSEPLGLKIKASPKHKGPYDFDHIQLVQDLSTEHSGPIWCMKFSNCGRLLATAGQDRLIRIWVLKSQLNYFQDLLKANKVSPTPSLESVPSPNANDGQVPSEKIWPFVSLSSYSGHTADLLDIAWSKSFFLLSSSMDRTVRLWHISRKECLCCFQHIDFVTAIAFHPRDDRYFLSGSLDGKLRLWNIPDKKVALWNEIPGPNNLITTANFCQNGKFAVVGTYDGRCIFYHTEQLKYHTQIILNRKKLGKITGIEPMPGEDKILVTSNDSRIRLYDLRDLSLTCKFTGAVARSSQIRASFSHDGKFIICGSENSFFYIWRSAHEYVGFGGARRDRNSYWESVKAHNAVVTCAIFAPDPDLIIKEMEGAMNYSPLGYVLASADFTGSIKIFVSRVKAKCSSLPASAIA